MPHLASHRVMVRLAITRILRSRGVVLLQLMRLGLGVRQGKFEQIYDGLILLTAIRTGQEPQKRILIIMSPVT